MKTQVHKEIRQVNDVWLPSQVESGRKLMTKKTKHPEVVHNMGCISNLLLMENCAVFLKVYALFLVLDPMALET